MAELFDPVRGQVGPHRFRTQTNIGEATPDILSPLCWSVWSDAAELSFLGSLASFGVLSRREAVPPKDPDERLVAAIYGRQFMNVDVVRTLLARVPGVSADDFERDLFGSVRPGLRKEPGAPRRIPVTAVKLPYTLFTVRSRVRRMHDTLRPWWRTEVFEVNQRRRQSDARPIDRLTDSADRFTRMLTIHGAVRFLLSGLQSAIVQAADKAGDPALASAVMAGQGNIEETALADDAWRLARRGMELDEFLARHGFHGPNEGNVYTRSWREDPSLVQPVVASHAERDDARSPRRREQAAREKRMEAGQRLLAASPAVSRPALRLLFSRTGHFTRTLELGKAGFLMALDGCRAAARELGREQADHGVFQDVDDAFFLTMPELRQVVAGERPDAADLIAYRRRNRAEYARMTLPVSVTGMPSSEDIRVASAQRSAAPAAGKPVELSGRASGGERVEGRARVVIDPSSPIDLEGGDILVCRFTDPSWAPLFPLVEALVIDIGGAASHGAVVAREMGIPFVIGTENGTSVISDGARIVVDGGQNQVRVLAD